MTRAISRGALEGSHTYERVDDYEKSANKAIKGKSYHLDWTAPGRPQVMVK